MVDKEDHTLSNLKKLKKVLERGSADALATLLQAQPELANTPVQWGLLNCNSTEPVHYLCDCVFSNRISDSNAATLAEILLQYGAAIDGRNGAEPPLIGAASLTAPGVARVLIERGADITLTALFGATALHWAAYTGMPDTVELLLSHGADCEARCTEFGATPLFWAVQGFSKYGPEKKSEQVAAARVLVTHGAIVQTHNSEGVDAVSRSRNSASAAMTELLLAAQ